jgi:predicted PurR-regulated permease PerM
MHNKTFIVLVVLVSLAFGWILLPFFGALFWATVLAILFTPLFRILNRQIRNRRNTAALLTLLIIILVVIIPFSLVTGMLVQEALALYKRVQSGELDFGRYLAQMVAILPDFVTAMLERADLTDFESIQKRFSASIMKGLQLVATQAVSIGQITLDFLIGFFIMLYVLFFLLRDGDRIMTRVRQALPLQQRLQYELAGKFTTVTRATIKGSLAVAVAQGALGGLIFGILGIEGPVFWGVVMAILSLLPAIGSALVWIPVAIYFLASGQVVQGIVLTAYGVLVIGLVDNVLRPILVGKDTKIPDYIVLVTTLGGIAIFGISGFVIGPLIAAMFIAVWEVMCELNVERSASSAPPEL